MGRVLVVGSSNTDLVCRAERFPRVGETLRGTTFATYAGGKGANQAIAAARAGAAVTFVGAIGAEEFGRQRLSELQGEGIDTSGVRVVEGAATGVALIVINATGDNGIVLVPGANDSVRPDDARAAIASRRHDVLSLNLEIPFRTVETAISANLGRTPTVLNAAPYDPRIVDVLNAIDVLVCNEIEAEQLLGYAITPELAATGAAELVVSGPRAVVITLGAAGAVLATESNLVKIPAPRVDVVDTTGAGDAFCGAFTAWLADGDTLEAAARSGVVAGSLAVTVEGAQPSLPRRAEIVELLRRTAYT